MIPALLIFTGIIAAGTFQSRMSFHGPAWTDVSGALFGCGLIAVGITMIAGA